MKRLSLIVIALITLGLTGCISHVGMHFTADDVAKAHIDPNKCRPLPNGQGLCHDVRVSFAAVSVKELQEDANGSKPTPPKD